MNARELKNKAKEKGIVFYSVRTKRLKDTIKVSVCYSVRLSTTTTTTEKRKDFFVDKLEDVLYFF